MRIVQSLPWRDFLLVPRPALPSCEQWREAEGRNSAPSPGPRSTAFPLVDMGEAGALQLPDVRSVRSDHRCCGLAQMMALASALHNAQRTPQLVLVDTKRRSLHALECLPTRSVHHLDVSQALEHRGGQVSGAKHCGAQGVASARPIAFIDRLGQR